MSRNNSKSLKSSMGTTAETTDYGGFSSMSYDNICIENKITDKNNLKITAKALETLWRKAKKINKKPCLILGIRKNENEIFVLQCFLDIKKNKQKGR